MFGRVFPMACPPLASLAAASAANRVFHGLCSGLSLRCIKAHLTAVRLGPKPNRSQTAADKLIVIFDAISHHRAPEIAEQDHAPTQKRSLDHVRSASL